MSNNRIGVDVGGTFTDVVFIDEHGEYAATTKHLTTRPNIAEGIAAGLVRLHDGGAFRWEDITEITVGSTLALNVLLEERGATTALITTKGFRDVLEIGRERRDRLYDLDQVAAVPLVPRRLRYEIFERVTARGEIVDPLDLVRAKPTLLEWLDATEVDSAAICLINSYLMPAHEEQLRDLLGKERPKLFVSTSVDLQRHYREYERTLVTCINAYVGPTMTTHLEHLAESLSELAPNASVRLTDSLGGAVNLDTAGRKPVLTIMSGPASGVAGAAAIARQRDFDENIIAMDMGGTSCDVTVVQGGRPDLQPTVSVGPHRFTLQAVDVHSIGAGGGTVAWVDDGGLLRVGPRSAGSKPGPACYGRNGTEATVTDAHAVLGHLPTDVLLGGEIKIDVARAWHALRTQLADPLAMPVHHAAYGVLRIADAEMQRAIETITIKRGVDPRSFGLVAYGGAAPLHATGIARNLGIQRVIIPRFAGVLCAAGAIWAPERYESARTWLVPTDKADPNTLLSLVTELERSTRTEAGRISHEELDQEVSFDMRFIGQTATLRIPVPDPRSLAALPGAHSSFLDRYQDVFGYILPGAKSEIENVRVRLSLAQKDIRMRARHDTGRHASPQRWRAAFEDASLTECDLWKLDGSARLPHPIAGPAVLAGLDSTVLLHRYQNASIDDYGNLIVHSAHEGARDPERSPLGG